MHKTIRGIGFGLLALALGAIAPAAHAGDKTPMPATVGPLFYQNSMNVFRRYTADTKKMFEFYGDVLGLKQIQTFTVGRGQQVARFIVGNSQVKFTKRTPDRVYHRGGVKGATGLRLITFFYPDEAALSQRFTDHGYPAPKFHSLPNSENEYALVKDPDGQDVELVVIPDGPDSAYERIEIGLTVSNMKASRNFYKNFVGLEALPPVKDPVFGVTMYPFRHGTTTINLRSFGANLPKDNGSGGIQYVVTNVDPVNEMAKARHITIESPLSTLKGFDLRTIWLDDPDGITNYFAETPQSRKARASGSSN
ncbi:MAG TPA: VOC family protein [Alphaproteobacteria bacterium]|nr:VOC family protein [Alphaproteobacteria bacterium]